MNKLLLFLTTILTLNCYSQILYEKGYFINNYDQKFECFIKNNDWAQNPTNFKYKVSENDDAKTIGIESVKEFGIYNISKFIRKTVNIDESSESLNDLSTDVNPIFNEKQLFLRVLVEGKATLYQGGSVEKFFYNIDNSNIEQLIFKSYKNSNNQVQANNLFRKQLWDNLKCSTIKTEDLLKLDYREDSLISVFCEYNKCSKSDYINYQVKQQLQKKDLFNLTLRPRLNKSSLNIDNDVTLSTNTDFGEKSAFGFGVEAEFIFPFNKNKWTLLVEPTYQSFNGEKTNKYSFLVAGPLTTEIKYTSIEIPIGVRHYFFLNKNSKIFIDAAFVYDLVLDSTLEFKKADNSVYKSLEISNGNNFAFGIGYKLYDKYSIELRYHTERNNLAHYNDWISHYKTTSIILGYSIF
ncbi:tRNA modification GTPase [Flavobacterium sp.]|uniref:tRNA modification GTPase n=1 Tax=Flavobacterium sp. TaxID=239 RepID=UPI002C279BAD|nr:tRNA modification GTPase [Flavobacterium sp.]HSD07520.1 hypothetical protein [Flavobacterium sp.]